MREFFINSFEKLVGVIVVLLALFVVIAGFGTMFGGMGPMGGQFGGGFVAGLIVLIVGALYVIFIGGLMYLGLGIYQNTKAAAEALQRMESKG